MHDRNHEGYRDPTATRAIRRADRQHEGHRRLTYLLGKTRAFREAAAWPGRQAHEQ